MLNLSGHFSTTINYIILELTLMEKKTEGENQKSMKVIGTSIYEITEVG